MVQQFPQGRAKEHLPTKRIANVPPRLVPPSRTWGGRILTLHLNYVAGYTNPLLFLFEQTHNYPVDDQGLLPGHPRARSVPFAGLFAGLKLVGLSPAKCPAKSVAIFFASQQSNSDCQILPSCFGDFCPAML